ncbi:hypothetical protein Tco_0519399 [Tanacetum coccineum]
MVGWCGDHEGGGDGCNGGGFDGGDEWPVAAREQVDRVDQLTRNIFGLGRKTRRKSFPVPAAAAVAGAAAAELAGNWGEGERAF